MTKLLIGLALIAALGGCAPVPIEEQQCYDSALNYIRGQKNGNCRDEDHGKYNLFRESHPVVAVKDEMKITYIGDQDGSGYCLTPAYGDIVIRTYCTLNGGTLDACVWKDVHDGEALEVTQLRRENPLGCNRQPWNVLETVFQATRLDFLDSKSEDPNYSEAAARVKGKLE